MVKEKNSLGGDQEPIFLNLSKSSKMRRLTSKKRFKEVNLDKKLSVQIYSTIETINHASGAHKWLIRAFFCCSKIFFHEKSTLKQPPLLTPRLAEAI